MERFEDLSEDIIEGFLNVFEKKAFPLPIKFLFIGDSKQKNLIKITKIAPDFEFVIGKELKVTINESLINAFDEEAITILYEQEIDKIHHNSDSGKIKLVKPDLSTFSGIVNKYGVEKVARANKVEELYHQQQKDDKGDTKGDFIV